MSLNPDEVKEAMKKATNVLWSIRESFGFPVFRKPLMQFAEQIRGSQQISPEQAQALRQQIESEQSQPVEEVRRPPAGVIRETLPRLPLPLGLRERVERIKLMPIRRGVGEVLRAYSSYISSPPKQRRSEETDEAYDTSRSSGLPHDIALKKARGRRASIEM